MEKNAFNKKPHFTFKSCQLLLLLKRYNHFISIDLKSTVLLEKILRICVSMSMSFSSSMILISSTFKCNLKSVQMNVEGMWCHLLVEFTNLYSPHTEYSTVVNIFTVINSIHFLSRFFTRFVYVMIEHHTVLIMCDM